jgi:hypothetical protein
MVDEYAVAAVGQIERHILVRLLAARAAVGIPDVDLLAVLHQGSEALTEAVHDFANSQAELLADVVPVGVGRDVGQRFGTAVRQHPAVGDELKRPPVAPFKAG